MYAHDERDALIMAEDGCGDRGDGLRLLGSMVIGQEADRGVFDNELVHDLPHVCGHVVPLQRADHSLFGGAAICSVDYRFQR